MARDGVKDKVRDAMYKTQGEDAKDNTPNNVKQDSYIA